MNAYCEFCDAHQPIMIEPLRHNSKTGNITGDILCDKCGYVIATLNGDEEGIYRIKKIKELLV